MVNFGDRWDCHKAQLRGNYHDNPYLQNSWNKYGEESFEFVIIYNCKNNENTEQVNLLEIKYIKHYRDLNLSYNIRSGGDGGHMFGKHLSEEAKRKIGEKNRISMTGRKASEKNKTKKCLNLIENIMILGQTKTENYGARKCLKYLDINGQIRQERK